MSSMSPPAPQAPAKKTSPILWILLGIILFVMLGGMLFCGGVFFLARKVAHDPSSIVRMIAAMNPNVEVLNVDDGKGTVTVRDKQTGKTFSMNLQDVKNGKFVVQEDGKPAVTVETNTKSGTMEVRSSEGVMKFGAGGKLPDWIPAYPGSNPEGTVSMQGAEGEAGSMHYNTRDSVDSVVNFYAAAMKKAGFKTSSNMMNQDGKTTGLVSAEDDATRRTAVITVAPGDETAVTITFNAKK
jgi:flagellar basal body-associated protein FliL